MFDVTTRIETWIHQFLMIGAHNLQNIGKSFRTDVSLPKKMSLLVVIFKVVPVLD